MSAFNWSVRVYYEDTDASGLVYHANYLKYMERARSEYLRASGYTHQYLAEQEQLLFVVSQIEMRYKKPAWFDDMLNISVSFTRINAASVDCLQTVQRDAALLCSAKLTIACLSTDSYTPKRIPSQIKDTFNHDY